MVYPAFGPAAEFSVGWMSHIVIRNVVATLLICGGWDWFLYFSPLAAKLHKYKINPVYPSMKQIRHDAGVTGRSHHMQCSSCYCLRSRPLDPDVVS